MEQRAVDVFKEVGFAGIFIVGCIVLIKYFISALQKKEETNQRNLEKIVEVVENNTKALIELRYEVQKTHN